MLKFELRLMVCFYRRYRICRRYRMYRNRITESQNSRGWKGPLWVI